MKTAGTVAGFVAINLFVGAIAGASPVVILGPVTDPGNGVSYELIGDKITGEAGVQGGTWSTIEADAEALGGHLATIHNMAEDQWLTDHFPAVYGSATLPFWIGLYDPTVGDGSGAQHAADFVWADGSTSTYRNWNQGEPNNTNNLEYYAVINYGYYDHTNTPYNFWNDVALGGSFDGNVPSSGPYFGIVELPVPEPASLGVLGVGCLLGLKRRKR